VYNCPTLCFGSFQRNEAPPPTCINGAIPQWPPLRDCLCHPTCMGSCSACAYTTVTAGVTTTPSPTVCQSCYNTAIAGACAVQAAACTGTCALLCSPYYSNNLAVYQGCETVPEWVALESCLCGICTNNVTCTANTC
jgi:hypothetical protein